MPTYTDQHEKDLHSIEEQLQNMMWLQQQCLENINKSQVEYMAELRTIKGKQQEMFENNDRFYNQVREEQREMAKEIQEVKNYQVNQTMIESTRNKALMEEFFSNQTNQYNMIRKEQNLLGKEILDVKKHQMNTNTMGSSSSSNRYEPNQALIKIREQHANFFENQTQLKEWTKNSSARECYSVWKGSLRSKERSFEAFLPRVPRLGVLQPDPATPRQPLIKSRHGQQLCLATPRRGNPRLCKAHA
ncbi:hypothetical protein PIB30_077604 [Stylosanthes scabra]|uniref:Uncharacterized protein n=1 Tax=Stylosanthes scabra TaxID=79078 RepID=A0ABU6QQR4_9FABA|nr:hypothetical protein [Stylosanthes scabra]